MWAGYVTNLIQNMDNTTNSHLESHNQKVKTVLDYYMTLHEALRGLLLLQSAAARSITHRPPYLHDPHGRPAAGWTVICPAAGPVALAKIFLLKF